MEMLFRDRRDAALQLAGRLSEYRHADGIVLAVPRGGVPVGEIVAKELELPLDIVLAKKLGHPSNPEYAVGAVSGETFLAGDIGGISEDYIRQQLDLLRRQLQEREHLFRSGRPAPGLKGKTLLLVDDGIATGRTLLAAIRELRRKGPAKIVVAVPVAPRDSCAEIAREADALVCLHRADYFPGVGYFYRDFRQVEDQEVIAILEENHRHFGGGKDEAYSAGTAERK